MLNRDGVITKQLRKMLDKDIVLWRERIKERPFNLNGLGFKMVKESLTKDIVNSFKEKDKGDAVG